MPTTALFQRLRIAGAAAPDVLVRAAAQRWNIDGFGMPHRERRRDQFARRGGSLMASWRRPPPGCRSARRLS